VHKRGMIRNRALACEALYGTPIGQSICVDYNL
jgi:hypothetical protein